MSGSTPPCDAYLLVYAFVCIALLFFLSLILYVMACVYTERVVRTVDCIAWVVRERPGGVVFVMACVCTERVVRQLYGWAWAGRERPGGGVCHGVCVPNAWYIPWAVLHGWVARASAAAHPLVCTTQLHPPPPHCPCNSFSILSAP